MIGPVELLVLLLAVVLLIVPIWVLVDAAARPDSQWSAAGQEKRRWLVLLIGGSFVPVIGVIPLIVYVVSIRPQLKRVAG